MDDPSPPPLLSDAPPRSGGIDAAPFIAEFLTSCGANFLQVGIFFYTQKRFGWSLRSNFLLACLQGIAYVACAMNARRLEGLLGPRGAITLVYGLMTGVTLLGAAFPYSHVLAILLVTYAGMAALSWPILESIVTTGVVADALGRRVALYNLLWSGAGAMVLAGNGWVIEHFPGGVFALPAIFHGASMAIMRFSSSASSSAVLAAAPHSESQQSLAASEPAAAHAHLEPEPELLRLRTAALWLSRVALPATYVLIYSLAALMPSLPVFRTVDTARQTLIGSTWMAARLLAFVALGLSAWWHTRPRILIVAALVMLVAFLGVVIRPSDLSASLGHGLDLPSMIFWQVWLGLALGMIYSASLYFGMVLSDGSTEHGGYHEALIGLGSVLGPGSGAVAQWLFPNNVQAGIIAVGSVVTASVAAVGITALLLRGGRDEINSHA